MGKQELRPYDTNSAWEVLFCTTSKTSIFQRLISCSTELIHAVPAARRTYYITKKLVEAYDNESSSTWGSTRFIEGFRGRFSERHSSCPVDFLAQTILLAWSIRSLRIDRATFQPLGSAVARETWLCNLTQTGGFHYDFHFLRLPTNRSLSPKCWPILFIV